MSSSAAFASVKLPASLVNKARDAAQPLRRSVAGQIEYWAMLGQVVEHTGLTVQEARSAIERYESAARATQAQRQAEAMIGQFTAMEADGSLAEKVREVVADNHRRAT